MSSPRQHLLTAALLLAPLLAAASSPGTPPPGLVLVETISRVEVDSTGQVTTVSTTPALPAEVEAAVHANLRKLRFEPPLKNGKPVAGVTYAHQDACAAPDRGAYRFVVKFRGNGPALQQPLAPAYPRDEEHRGQESKWIVTYAIATDGTASLLEARRTDGVARAGKNFQSAIGQWVSALHYQPEFLDGQPVATKISVPVEFRLTSAPRRGPKYQQARAAANDSCVAAIAARDEDDREIALDSPFKPLPVN